MKLFLKVFVVITILIGFLSSCKKIAGPGGTSVIRGKVVGVINSTGEPEALDIIVKNGNDIEHGDYFILNGVANGSLYYIWYNNPTWVSNGNPNLQGRIGIQVNFNYSDSNLDVANATFAAMNAVLSSEFTLTQNNDIISMIALTNAEIADADNGTSNFNVDITNQGFADVGGNEIATTEERVYLIYGDGEVFNDIARTGADGVFTFEGLQVGKYKLYALSKDAITGEKKPIYKQIEISEKASINDIGIISIEQ
jgi:hypothetical protein